MEIAIERAATLCEGERIQYSDLPPNIAAVAKPDAAEDAADATLPEFSETGFSQTNNGTPAKPASTTPDVPLNQVVSLKNYLREQEHAYLQKVMEQCEGDKEKAAIVLGVSLATLYRKLSGEDKD